MSDTPPAGDKPPPATYAEIIALWPTAAEFGRAIGVTDVSARSYRRRGIPPEYWTRLVAAAGREGFSQVTYELLAELAAKPPSSPSPSEEAVAANEAA